MTLGESMDRRRFISGLAGAVVCVPQIVSGVNSAEASSVRWEAIQKLIKGYVADRKVAGVAVAVSYGEGGQSYLRAGTIAVDSPRRFDENSICRIYSMSKPVTGAAASGLAQNQHHDNAIQWKMES